MKIFERLTFTILILYILTFSQFSAAGFWYELSIVNTHPSVISGIQKRLNELGYLHSKPDGNWGKATSMAFDKFSKSHNLKFDIAKVNKIPVRDVLTKEHIKALWNIDFDLNSESTEADSEETMNFLKQIGVSLY